MGEGEDGPGGVKGRAGWKGGEVGGRRRGGRLEGAWEGGITGGGQGHLEGKGNRMAGGGEVHGNGGGGARLEEEAGRAGVRGRNGVRKKGEEGWPVGEGRAAARPASTASTTAVIY